MDPMQLLIQKCFTDPLFVETLYDNLGPNFIPTLLSVGIMMDPQRGAEVETFLAQQDIAQRKALVFFFKATALTPLADKYVFQSGTLPPPWSNTEVFASWVDNL